MNNNFNVKNMVNGTSDCAAAKLYNSWRTVVALLDKMGFNEYEAEALLHSKHVRWAAKPKVMNSSTVLRTYLEKNGILHRSKTVNALVMDKFAVSDKLELNDEGVPCHRGTMPGNYHPNKTILVPIGTPRSCDPTSETYWSA
jgi:hypothetical protein